ncbi:AraC family transcriptional regulator [Luminiphilus sp. nBUS_16]|uniref:AraC family transcriptional regulator n=1 Tax=Luminiphilus sp. nBUS_16 TaxID=3395315 RepID=UPI003EBA438E
MQAGTSVVTRLGTVPHSNIAYVLEVAKEHDYDLSPLLDSAGLNLEAISDSSSDLTGEQYYGFLSQVLATLDIPAFGCKVGQRFSLSDFGVLGYACVSSSTIRQFLQTFFRFQQIVGSSASFREALREEGGNAMIEIHSSCSNENLLRFDIEEAVGQWTIAAGDMWSGKESMYTCVNLSLPEPDYAQELQTLVGCPVFYQQARNELVFPAELLEGPIVMADELTAKLCEQQCHTLLQGLTQQEGLVEQVRKLIINQAGRISTPEDVASKLHISYRTLRRRLSDEGTSFKEIHNELRMGMAGEYMRQTELTTQEIAFLLGYSEASNFHRAFKLWFGKTPGDYRLSGSGPQ